MERLGGSILGVDNQREGGAYLDRYTLTERGRAAIRDNDVATLYPVGANPYLLRAHCIGMRIPEAVSLAALRSVAKEVPHG